MRIITGKHRGRKLISPKHEGVRPTSDRVKESVFNILADKLNGSVVLDLFAGSGSLGFEALSRGASEVYFVDNNKDSIKVISENAKMLNENPKIILADHNVALLKFYKQKIKFDIIFIDPPYNTHLAEFAINKIKEFNLLNSDGIIVWENLSSLNKLKNFNSPFEIFDIRTYGETRVDFFRN